MVFKKVSRKAQATVLAAGLLGEGAALHFLNRERAQQETFDCHDGVEPENPRIKGQKAIADCESARREGLTEKSTATIICGPGTEPVIDTSIILIPKYVVDCVPKSPGRK